MIANEQTPILTGGDEPTGFTAIYLRFIRPCIAEFTALLVFVFVGVASSSNSDTVAVALAHGLTIALLVSSFGEVSGGHVNPAVTLGVVLSGGCEVLVGIAYLFFQLAGSIVGAGLARAVLSYSATGSNASNALLVYDAVGGGVPQLGTGVTQWNGVLTEAIMTFILVLTVLMSAVDQGLPVAPLAIGFAVTVDIILGAGITGAAMNPARSFGPAVIANNWTDEWIYWVGPIIGALCAAATYRIFLAKNEKRLLFKTKND